VDRNTFNPYTQQPDKLFTEVSVKPHIAENGEPTGGYVITGMKDQALLNKIGLQPGDIVTRVNGKNPIELVNIVNSSTLKNVNIDFIRAGKNRRLNFTIKD
jgi:type II secretory pathway component PulC